MNGIWEKYTDTNDINATDTSFPNNTLVSGDDFGLVKLFRFPCIKKGLFFFVFIFLFNFAYKGRVTTIAYANYCGPALPNPPCQPSLWEETGVLGADPRPSAERWLMLFSHEDWVREDTTGKTLLRRPYWDSNSRP